MYEWYSNIILPSPIVVMYGEYLTYPIVSYELKFLFELLVLLVEYHHARYPNLIYSYRRVRVILDYLFIFVLPPSRETNKIWVEGAHTKDVLYPMFEAIAIKAWPISKDSVSATKCFRELMLVVC